MSNNPQFFQQEMKSQSYRDAVALDLRPGASQNTKFAYTESIAAAGDVWPPATSYVFPIEAGQPIEAVSAAAGDTAVDLSVIVVNAVTGLEETRSVTLNGTNPVLITGDDIIAVNRAFVSGGTAAVGDVTIRGTGAPNSTVFAIIPSADQQTVQAPFIPSDKVALITNITASLNKTGGSDAAAVFKLVIEKPGGVPRTAKRYGVQRSGVNVITVDLETPTVVPPLAKIRIISEPTADVDISAFYSIILVDKELLPPSTVQKAEDS